MYDLDIAALSSRRIRTRALGMFTTISADEEKYTGYSMTSKLRTLPPKDVSVATPLPRHHRLALLALRFSNLCLTFAYPTLSTRCK